ncbi:hypothetical protein CcI49_23260 [Frankia sp. CcI49]|uniref:hypothetical protein n=2 Tax=unclassified Frankia TaxID=2632575 RepID=UPI0009787056|nr:hypothetical protein [Frankia sp. R43]ONH58377.1 hypothetical protein CcI49_23260 [Frankia sp. CcI49]
MSNRRRRSLIILVLSVYVAISAAANLGAFGAVAANVSMAVVLAALLVAFLWVVSYWRPRGMARRASEREG